jgi:maltose phosphorylase
MAKLPTKYYKIDEWNIIEEGYNPDRHQVSESIFSLGNEFMGARGFFEEGTITKHLIGTYFNGVYEYGKDEGAPHYKGIVNETHFMVNGVNFFYMRLKINNEIIDLATATFKKYKRVLNLQEGVLSREFTLIQNGKDVCDIKFERFVSLDDDHIAGQRLILKPYNEIDIEVVMGLDQNTVHWGMTNFFDIVDTITSKEVSGLVSKTKTTDQSVAAAYKIHNNLNMIPYLIVDENKVLNKYKTSTSKKWIFEKIIDVEIDKTNSVHPTNLLNKVTESLRHSNPYDVFLNAHKRSVKSMWERQDIVIEGDAENQQGIRFCIFQLYQTYHGASSSNNIGAKGLTGEAYSGHTFWDTETYCLPFYLFSNETAAKNLLLYRYSALDIARARAKELDCDGACYPIATLNGAEACTLWQHASLQFQPSTAVAYGIYHYVIHSGDKGFLYNEGIEMLIEISKFMLTRGQWNRKRTKFGYYGVMGPDEFQMMVNHNAYTNYMAQQTFFYTLQVLNELKEVDEQLYNDTLNQFSVDQNMLNAIEEAADKMYIPRDEDSLLIEQHEGFFDLPHVDVDSIPMDQFPLYSNWSYDRIYRNNMIKQPDVLMFMFLYNQSFTFEEKKENYEFYEPLTIHESSLSPSIHSIFASELNKHDEAKRFFGFATRMDLDDYNRNTHEGLHTTSIAAAWMNIVYGFGGFRSDMIPVKLSPTIPEGWKRYQFKVTISKRLMTVNVTTEFVEIMIVGEPLSINLYDEIIKIDQFYKLPLRQVN